LLCVAPSCARRLLTCPAAAPTCAAVGGPDTSAAGVAEAAVAAEAAGPADTIGSVSRPHPNSACTAARRPLEGSPERKRRGVSSLLRIVVTVLLDLLRVACQRRPAERLM